MMESRVDIQRWCELARHNNLLSIVHSRLHVTAVPVSEAHVLHRFYDLVHLLGQCQLQNSTAVSSQRELNAVRWFFSSISAIFGNSCTCDQRCCLLTTQQGGWCVKTSVLFKFQRSQCERISIHTSMFKKS
jgi:hypothetical protein